MDSGSRVRGGDVVVLREEDVVFGDDGFGKGLPEGCGKRLIGLEQDFAGLAVDDVRDTESPFEVGERSAHLRDLGPDEFYEKILGNAFMRSDDQVMGLGIADLVGQLAVDKAGRNVPEQVLIAQRDTLDLVESAQDIFIRLHPKGAKEDGAKELALAVDADIENILGVVFEFNPRPAVRNDFAEEV